MEKIIQLSDEQIKTMQEYVDNNPIEIYIDYNDELSDSQVDAILEGRADEVRSEIEFNAQGWEDFSYYWDEMKEALNLTDDQMSMWLDSEECVYPWHTLDDHDWDKLLSNTTVNISGIMWECEWNFYNWAYAGPVNYSDVKESLKVLGINPKDFHDKLRGGSMTSGEGKLRGWFPDMPQRKAAVDIDDLYDNMCSLYNGVLHFCFGNLADIVDVMSSDSKELIVKKGTNVVMYDRGNGAGITEVELQEDVVIRRKDIEFYNDTTSTYGVQACYGFMQSYWNQGSIHNK